MTASISYGARVRLLFFFGDGTEKQSNASSFHHPSKPFLLRFSAHTSTLPAPRLQPNCAGNGVGSAVIHCHYLVLQTGKNAMTNAPHFLSASTLTGDAVKNLKGESLGDLKDIMIDTDNGTIAYGVLSFGGVLGLGEKLFAVPWEAIKVDGENEELILNVEKEQLKDAPGFDKDNWPNFADTRFATQVREYYIR
jgi:sporulation protein YlmC with PRC-barrel domain